MARTDSVPSHQALETAAQWFALLRSSEASERRRAEWRAWLAQSDDHRKAWRYVEAISRRFGAVHDLGDRRAVAAALSDIRQRRTGRRRLLGSLAALAATGTLGWLGWRHGPFPEMALAWTADYRTRTGEIRDLRLVDGSQLWLNTATAVNADFGPTLRRLALVTGEILIETAGAGDARPFVVETSHGRLQAPGTRFTVREQEGATLVAVYAGAVEVRTGATARRRVVSTGEQLHFDRDAIAAPQAAERAREAWADGVLLADDITLGQLVAELRRYQRGYLGVAPEVAELRVLGGYPLRDPDKVLAMLEAVLPVRVRRTLPWWVSIEPAASDSTG